MDDRLARPGYVVRSDGAVVNEADNINEDGSQNFRMVVADPEDVTLIDAATSPVVGSYEVGSKQLLTIEIYGTASAATVNFRAISASGTPRPMMGVSTADVEPSWSGGVGQIWQFTVTGLVAFQVELASVTGGNVSVKGRAL
ncbi:hypothetical protein [Paenibacillus sp. FSL R7-0331]|uniref:hypothetical protein n=1 Tax=Paenibacillus sp. FSL R7-0331 TaxID=1536773 RepID=UPI0004F783AC|nr:hypothetical protein [Paenibacillus sp. FSL R7-0331]AIQ54579.1 hypothetical protein R70331_25775 [Paenibacillus sp. FSL R7-0331]